MIGNRAATYIEPNLSFGSLDEIEKSPPPRMSFPLLPKNKCNIEDVLNRKRVMVLSEPGYGKTSLLLELLRKIEDVGGSGVFVDLKKINQTDSLDEYLKKIDQNKNIPKITSLSRGGSVLSPIITTHWKCDDVARTICLDALDEVKHEDLFDICEKIAEFAQGFSGNIYVSCRKAHFLKNRKKFQVGKFEYLQILPFYNDDAKKFLENNGVSDIKIDHVFSMLQSSHGASIIQVPRYLCMLVDFIKTSKSNSLESITKTTLFEHFIYQKLDIEDDREGKNKKDLVMRVLEKLALQMEMYQTNLLSKSDLMTFFDDTHSNLNISFLHQVTLQSLCQRSVLKDNIDSIEFENTEFQECLAAKEIVRIGKTPQTVFDLIVDPDLYSLHPSWAATLEYLCDLEKSTIFYLIDFLNRRDVSVSDEVWYRLLTKVDARSMSDAEKEMIFSHVFEFYQNKQQWINYDVAQNLVSFFTPSKWGDLQKYLAQSGDDYDWVKKGNVVLLLQYLIEGNLLTEKNKSFWKKELISLINNSPSNYATKRYAITSLGKFKDIRLLKKVKMDVGNDDLCSQVLIKSCVECDPNDQFSIGLFIKQTKLRNVYARDGLYSLVKQGAVEKLLDAFARDVSFLAAFLDQESIFSDEDVKIKNNINAVWNEAVAKKVEAAVIGYVKQLRSIHLRSAITKPRVIIDFAQLLRKHRPDFIFKLIKTGLRHADHYPISNIWHIVAELIKKEQVEKFIGILGAKYRFDAFRILEAVKYLDKSDSLEIYEEGRKYLSLIYQKEERVEHRGDKKIKNATSLLLDELSKKLEPEKGKYSTEVFSFYLRHETELSQSINNSQKERLVDLIKNSVFKFVDPSNIDFRVNGARKNSNFSFTMSTHAPLFGDCILIANSLNIDVSKYRGKIINYIPFAERKKLDAIFKLIKKPSPSEIKSLLSIYRNPKKRDLALYLPGSFIEACLQFSIKEAAPILKAMVSNAGILIHDRQSALKALIIFQPSKKYLVSVFRKYQKSRKEPRYLAFDANRLLIEMFNDKEAVKYRISELKKRLATHTPVKGAHFLNDFERESMDKSFAKPIMELNSAEFQDNLLDLLNYSFKVYAKGDEYSKYASYLWEIVFAYYRNLKKHKNFSYFKRLSSVEEENPNLPGMNWFRVGLLNLKQEYLRFIGKPESFSDCVTRYNTMKDKQYIKVSSVAQLSELLKEVIDQDIRRWVEHEGAYKIIDIARGKQEDLIQKTLKSELENCLLRRGLRGCEILREVQLLDDQRTDYLVSYGFIEPILIELKRADNREVYSPSVSRKYRSKLIKYMNGSKTPHCVFLIFQTNKKVLLDVVLPKMRGLYKNDHNIEVMGINCCGEMYEEAV